MWVIISSGLTTAAAKHLKHAVTGDPAFGIGRLLGTSVSASISTPPETALGKDAGSMTSQLRADSEAVAWLLYRFDVTSSIDDNRPENLLTLRKKLLRVRKLFHQPTAHIV